MVTRSIYVYVPGGDPFPLWNEDKESQSCWSNWRGYGLNASSQRGKWSIYLDRKLVKQGEADNLNGALHACEIEVRKLIRNRN